MNDDSSLFVSLFSASKYFIRKSSKVGTTTLKLRALFYRPTTKYSHGASIKARGFPIFSAHIAPEAQIHLRHTSYPLRVVDLSNRAHVVLNQHTHRFCLLDWLFCFSSCSGKERKQEWSAFDVRVVLGLICRTKEKNNRKVYHHHSQVFATKYQQHMFGVLAKKSQQWTLQTTNTNQQSPSKRSTTIHGLSHQGLSSSNRLADTKEHGTQTRQKNAYYINLDMIQTADADLTSTSRGSWPIYVEERSQRFSTTISNLGFL